MDIPVNPSLTLADKIVLDNLRNDGHVKQLPDQDSKTVALLDGLNDSSPTIVTSWDLASNSNWLVAAYTRWASGITRHPQDVVFITHTLIYLSISLPSAIYLYYNFKLWHGFLHALWTAYSAGPFTLLMHNHIHQNGLLKRQYRWLDVGVPYILCPLMGHTCNSYYYHHTKMHHVEGNGPRDISSTLRYQRDSILNFLHYAGRFLFTLWFELPLYFLSTKKIKSAIKVFAVEIFSYTAIYLLLTKINRGATVFTFLIPLVQMRLAMAVGNWGQHCLLDKEDPCSDFRSSITLIDVASNRICFNDGYHTSHHLHPRRHWRAHPSALIQQKEQYTKEDAFIFYDIDFMQITYRILTKNYGKLAKHLLPLGKQKEMNKLEIAEMLEQRARKFTEEEINTLWPEVARKKQ